MHATITAGVVEPLSQSRLDVVDPREDVRGRVVTDSDGVDVGRVNDLFLDPTERRARFVTITPGADGTGDLDYLVPVDAISTQAEGIVIHLSADRIAEGPQVDGRSCLPWSGSDDGDRPDHDESPAVAAAYRHYGVARPFWSAGYRQPAWRQPLRPQRGDTRPTTPAARCRPAPRTGSREG